MPRNYQPFTPAGDPTDPTSLLTPSVNIGQVNFTAQTNVAQPENQWETLQTILGLGAGVVKQSFDYAAESIRNERSINIAIERAREEQEIKAEKAARSAESKIKEHQDGVLNSYDARITAAMLKDSEAGFMEASMLADEFAKMYPQEDNPYMFNKAQDQFLRIRNFKKVWDNEQRVENDRYSAAAQGVAISDALSSLERLSAEFNNPETRSKVTMLFPENPIQGNGFNTAAVPDDQIHTAVVNYLMTRIDPAKLNALTDEDRVSLSTSLIRMSESFRNNILNERNKVRTFRRIEMRTTAALTKSLNIETTDDLSLLFSEFDNIAGDREAGFINATQQSRLEGNLASAIGMNAGSDKPVVGALGVIDAVQGGIDAGAIPMERGTRVINILRRRAEGELKGIIAGMKADANAVPDIDSSVALATVFQTNPALEMGQRMGIYERDAEGNVVVVQGKETLARELESFSKEYEFQKTQMEKKQGVLGSIESVNNSRFVMNEIMSIQGDTTVPPDQKIVAYDNRLLTEYMSAAAFAGDPQKSEQYLVTSRMLVKNAVEDIDPMGFNVADLDTKDRERFDAFYQAMGEGNLVEARKKLNEVVSGYYEGGTGLERTTPRRAMMYTMMESYLDRTMTDEQKEISEDPTGISFLQQVTEEDMAVTARDMSINLQKNSKKLNPVQRSLEEDRVAQVVAASQTFPEDWFKYVGETYFMAGSSEEMLRRGYALLSRTRPPVYDPITRTLVNRPSLGSVEMELAMRTADPVMFDTLAIADGLSIGTNRTPDFFLKESHAVVLRRVAEEKSSANRMAREQGELIPTPPIDYRSGAEMAQGSTLVSQRRELLRDAFEKEFGQKLGRMAGNDPYFTLDAEDYNRLNAMFIGFKSRGYSDSLAIRAAVGKMPQLGYSIVIEEDNVELFGPRMNLVFDPNLIVFSPREKQNNLYAEYIREKVREHFPQGAADPFAKGNSIFFTPNVDLTRPDSVVPYTIVQPNGQRFESGIKGVSAREFRVWEREKRKTMRSPLEEQGAAAF